MATSKPAFVTALAYLALMFVAGAAGANKQAARSGPAEPAIADARPRLAKDAPKPGEADNRPATPHEPGVWGVSKAVYARFSRDNASMVAASVAFYLFLSIFPALASLVSLYGLIGNPAQISDQLQGFAGILPPEVVKVLTDSVTAFAATSTGGRLTTALMVSILLGLWSARAAMSAIMFGLNVAFEVTERRSFIMQTAISLALTIGGVVFAAIALGFIAIAPIVLTVVQADWTINALVVVGRWPLLEVLVLLVFALLYRFAPDRRSIHWQWITMGSFIASVLWLGGSFAFSVYVTKFGSYNATYGALGAVVVLMLWFWVTALILILGAEINAELESRAEQKGDPLGGLPSGAASPQGAPNQAA